MDNINRFHIEQLNEYIAISAKGVLWQVFLSPCGHFCSGGDSGDVDCCECTSRDDRCFLCQMSP